MGSRQREQMRSGLRSAGQEPAEARRGGKFGIVMQRIGVADGARERTGRTPARVRAERKSARAAGCGSFLLPQSGKSRGKAPGSFGPSPGQAPAGRPSPAGPENSAAGLASPGRPPGKTSRRKLPAASLPPGNPPGSPPGIFSASLAISSALGMPPPTAKPSMLARPAIGPRLACPSPSSRRPWCDAF